MYVCCVQKIAIIMMKHAVNYTSRKMYVGVDMFWGIGTSFYWSELPTSYKNYLLSLKQLSIVSCTHDNG